jgi:putative flippase GtrA
VTARAWLTLPRVPASAVRYAATGLLAYVVDTGTLWALYHLAGVPLWAATTCGFWLSFAVNFTAQKYFTFGVRSGAGGQLVRFLVMVGLNYLATLGIVTGLVALGAAPVAAKTIAVALLTVVNYVGYRFWVFRA